MERLERLLEQLGDVDGYTVKLERVRSAGVSAELCGHLPSLPFGDDFLDEVRQEYGGGKYRGRVYDRRNEYKVGFTFTIAGTPRAPRDLGPAGLVGVGPGTAVSDPRLERIERALEQLAGALARQHEAALTAQLPARSAEDDIDRLLKIAKAMRELAPTPAPAPTTAGSPIETLRMLLEVRELLDSAGGGGGQSDMAALVEGGVKPIAQLMTRSLDLQEKSLMARQERERRAAGAQSPASPAARPLSSATAAADAPPRVLELPVERVHLAGPDPAGDLVRAMLAEVPAFARLYLATQARMDRDPSAYAIVVLDTIQQSSPAAYAELPALLERPDFLDTMLECVPEWAGTRPWFAELVQEMRVALAGEEDAPHLQEDAPDTGADADAPDAREAPLP